MSASQSGADSAPQTGNTSSTTYVVSVSSGLGSAFAWHLTDILNPYDEIVGVFADVNGEHPDNYRFLDEIAQHVRGPLIRLDNDGKTIWDTFKEARFLANSRVDVCSRVLKREPILAYMKENHDPANTVMVLGIDWTEEHRFLRAKAHWERQGYRCEAPMCEPINGRYFGKEAAQEWLDCLGVKRPLLYDLGFSHANCGGGCVKAGIKQFSHMLKVLPEEFARWEAREEEMRAYLGRDDVAILRSRVGGSSRPLTLRELRESQEKVPELFDNEDWGGCGCFTMFDDDEAA